MLFALSIYPYISLKLTPLIFRASTDVSRSPYRSSSAICLLLQTPTTRRSKYCSRVRRLLHSQGLRKAEILALSMWSANKPRSTLFHLSLASKHVGGHRPRDRLSRPLRLLVSEPMTRASAAAARSFVLSRPDIHKHQQRLVCHERVRSLTPARNKDNTSPFHFSPAPIMSRPSLLFLPHTHGAMKCDRGLKRAEVRPRLTPNAECHVGEGFLSVVVPAYNEGDGVKLTLSTIEELAEVCAEGVAVVALGCILSAEISCSPAHVPPLPYVDLVWRKLFPERVAVRATGCMCEATTRVMFLSSPRCVVDAHDAPSTTHVRVVEVYPNFLLRHTSKHILLRSLTPAARANMGPKNGCRRLALPKISPLFRTSRVSRSSLSTPVARTTRWKRLPP